MVTGWLRVVCPEQGRIACQARVSSAPLFAVAVEQRNSRMQASANSMAVAEAAQRKYWKTVVEVVAVMSPSLTVDVLECPRCRGPMKIIAEITDPKVIKRFLAALNLPTEAPEIERARPPPQMDFGLVDVVDQESAIETDMNTTLCEA
jgi:hypothetical protein